MTWTDANGTTHTQSITNWRDEHTLVSVKEQIEVTLSGNLPQTRYAVRITRVLENTPLQRLGTNPSLYGTST